MSERLLSIIKRLEKYPHMIARIEGILNVTENIYGDCDLADDAEMKMIEEVNKMGKQMLSAWGEKQEEKKRKVYEEDANFVKRGKKKHTGKQHSEK